MAVKAKYIGILFILGVSCTQWKVQHVADKDFISICVDAAISIDTSLNNSRYWIDFDIPVRNKFQQTFLTAHPNFCKIESDTLWDTPEKFDKRAILERTLIRFDEVHFRGDLITVTLSKVATSDNAIGLQVTFKNENGKLSLVEKKSIWFS